MHALDTILGHSKLYVLIAGAVGWLIVRLVAGWADVPTFEGDSVVLLATPGTVRALLVLIVGYAAALVVCHLLCGRWSKFAGWATATFGLAAVSMRGGPLGDQLLGVQPGFMLLLALELVLLSGVVALGWLATGRLFGSEGGRGAAEPVDQKLLALACATVGCVLVVLLLARTDDKMQALMAAFFGGWIGAYAAHQYVETRPSPWFWGGPVLCGLVGYVAAWVMADPQQLAIGEPSGFLAPLARVAPLDYASFGIAGAALGYAMSRQKFAERRVEQRTVTPDHPEPVPTPVNVN